MLVSERKEMKDMGFIEEKTLDNHYDDLGDLTDQEYIAVKSVSKKAFYAVSIDAIKKIDAFGVERDVMWDDIKIGDNLKLTTTIRSLAGGQTKTGNLPMNNVTDVQRIGARRDLYLENDQFCITTAECGVEVGILKKAIMEPNWVTVNELKKLVLPDATLSNYKDVKAKHQGRSQAYRQDLGLDSLGFEETFNRF